MNDLAIFLVVVCVSLVSIAGGIVFGSEWKKDTFVQECATLGVYTDRQLIVECKVFRPQQKERV